MATGKQPFPDLEDTASPEAADAVGAHLILPQNSTTSTSQCCQQSNSCREVAGDNICDKPACGGAVTRGQDAQCATEARAATGLRVVKHSAPTIKRDRKKMVSMTQVPTEILENEALNRCIGVSLPSNYNFEVHKV